MPPLPGSPLSWRDGLRAGIYSQETRDPIIADEHEKRGNPRSKSAKLRWARRGEGGYSPTAEPPVENAHPA